MREHNEQAGGHVPAQTDPDLLAREALDAFHRMIVHYGLWFAQVEQRLGLETCLEVERTAWEKSFAVQMARLAKILGFEVDEHGVPLALKSKSPQELQTLLEGLSVNWLANDGIWFQAVEQKHGMTAAQECNDQAWARFSPFEAACVKALHPTPEGDPLDVLAAALDGRLYSQINQYSIERPDKMTLILYMKDCRVQSARKRKGLADYPCRSGGTIEYTTFAHAIDPRIKTECIGCPPDEHPTEWFCAWKFTV
jgi:hypothetical protein